jgi:eukaryotic-like serine/threonine-protein kinase
VGKPVELKPGDLFAGNYRVQKQLAEGGMGTLYVVEHERTGRRCALKLMLPEIVELPGMQKRFELEARVGARIESDHVVEVVDAGVDAATGAPWLAMELLEGEDLAAYVHRTGPLPTGDAREVLDQVCHALGEAHRQTIVHRDLKPENIFLAKPKRKGVRFMVKVLDFGIAKVVAEAKTTSSKTRTGLGTPLWMAPEQADPSRPIGPSADVWALGLITFYLLTGRYFWKTAYVESASLMMLLNEAFVLPVPPASVRAAEYGVGDRIPPGVDVWLAQCVTRDAGGRYADAARAYEALEPLLIGAASSTPHASTPAPLAPAPGSRPGIEPTLGSGTEEMPELRPKIATLPAKPAQPSRQLAVLTIGVLAVLGGLGAIVWLKDAKTCPEGMVLIPAVDAFTMGSNDDRDNEKPPHKVKLSAFCMDKTEVTVAAYRHCTKEERNGKKCSPAPATEHFVIDIPKEIEFWSQFCNGDRADHDMHPINCVDWSQASDYCNWTGGYLPSEAQWEYAARGTDGRKYPWGNNPPGPKLLNACGKECQAMLGRLGRNYERVMYEEDDLAGATAVVGSYPKGASPFGILDMAGNVEEWAADLHEPYENLPIVPVDPQHNSAGAGDVVLRGGTWGSDEASAVRASRREGLGVQYRLPSVGFRCASSPK